LKRLIERALFSLKVVYIYKDESNIVEIATDLEEFGKVEAIPVLEGKRMIMFMLKEEK
jgi:translation initiation factor IF-3